MYCRIFWGSNQGWRIMHEKFPQILKMFGSQKNPMSIMYLLYICRYMIKAPFGWCRYIYMYMRIYIYTHILYIYPTVWLFLAFNGFSGRCCYEATFWIVQGGALCDSPETSKTQGLFKGLFHVSQCFCKQWFCLSIILTVWILFARWGTHATCCWREAASLVVCTVRGQEVWAT